MKINFVDIQNFRKLKKCRIEFSKKETIFVGANNSGKTTAMDALMIFFKAKKLTTRDFTLTNWNEINSIGETWVKETDKLKIDLSIEKWKSNLPSLDVWLDVDPTEIHYVSHLIPSLDWDGGILGVRLRYEPNDIAELYNDFILKFRNSRTIATPKDDKDTFNLWPKNLWDFLENEMAHYFSIKTYLLDPSLKDSTQELLENNTPLDVNAFNGLIKVDIINAQRGFSDVNSESSETMSIKNLSSQLRNYYDKHLNPSINPTINDIEALRAVHVAKETFDEKLKDSFSISLSELEFLNYPGFGNPKISLSSKFNTVEGLNHDSSVQYNLDGGTNLSLPEKYNGLGYQNLISMIFKLITFRDEWMQIGKSLQKNDNSEKEFEPLHLILIEEPEAHLHAQVQQVFIKEAYNVLRNNVNLKDKTQFSSQLIVSTHSSHIAHETNLTTLRYFKRDIGNSKSITTSTVINLSKTFGTSDDTTKFATRYLKTTHCDLFFADAVLIVEGPAERMLLPYFIKNHTKLDTCYISILEIGGSHAHKLQPLIENLGIICLIITDIDSIKSIGNVKTQPEKSKGYKTNNDTLKKWIPIKEELDDLLELEENFKTHTNFPVKVAYQIPLKFKSEKKEIEAYPYTFEDSLVMENRDTFKALDKAKGLLKKMVLASKEVDIIASSKMMYEAINADGAKKAEFALELLYLEEPNKLKTPKYIDEGLKWLESKLITNKEGLTRK